MKIEDILALVSDNTEATTAIKALNTKATNSDALVEQIQTLQSQKQEVINSRKTQDGKYSEMLKLLGVEELTPEAVDGFNKKLNAKGDDGLKAEVANLQSLLQAETDKGAQTVADYESKLMTMGLDNAIVNSGLGASVANEKVYGIVAGMVKEGARLVEGKIVYQDDKGATIYDGSNTPVTVESRIKSLQSDPGYAGLFKPDVNGGGGASGNKGGGNASLKRSEMSHSEKGAYIREHGNDAYLKLNK